MNVDGNGQYNARTHARTDSDEQEQQLTASPSFFNRPPPRSPAYPFLPHNPNPQPTPSIPSSPLRLNPNNNNNQTPNNQRPSNNSHNRDAPPTSRELPAHNPMLALEVAVKPHKQHHDRDGQEGRAEGSADLAQVDGFCRVGDGGGGVRGGRIGIEGVGRVGRWVGGGGGAVGDRGVEPK